MAHSYPQAGDISVYALTGEQRLRFTYGQGFRAPQFGELYLNTPPFFVGNPDLKPERSEGITAGYAWASRRLQASADYFHTNVQDGITFDLSKRPFTYGNLREFVSQGVNGTLSVSLPFGFVPQFSYAYVAREDDNGVEVGGPPKNAANLKILWSESRYGLRANLRNDFDRLVQMGHYGFLGAASNPDILLSSIFRDQPFYICGKIFPRKFKIRAFV